MTGAIGEHAAELAALWPALAAALERDTTAGGTVAGGVLGAMTVVNADVLAAVVTLSRDVPAVTCEACEVLGEPWRHRPPLTCLRALPRLAGRMHDLGLVAEERCLEGAVRGWVRTAKVALNLIDRPWQLPPWVVCPDHQFPLARLVHVGAERAIRDSAEGPKTELVREGFLLCPHCGTSWPMPQWEILFAALKPPAWQHAS